MPCLRGRGKYVYARRGRRLLNRKETSAAATAVLYDFQRGRGERLLNKKETSAAPKKVGKADLQDGKEEWLLKRKRRKAVE